MRCGKLFHIGGWCKEANDWLNKIGETNMSTKKVVEIYGEEVEILEIVQKDKDHVLVTTTDETRWIPETAIKSSKNK